MRRLLLIAVIVLSGCARDDTQVVIGSKSFTESVVLGEALTQLTVDAGFRAEHRAALGGTRLVFNALAAGEIDAYVEYSGTLANEIFAGEINAGSDAIEDRLATDGIAVAGSIGFENNYALGMPESLASSLGVATISDLVSHPDLIIRVSNEFLDRADGWPALAAHYQLPQTDVRGVDHDIAYRALDAGDADLTELYTTDAEIDYYRLRALEDDREFFPRYDALLLYRTDLVERIPGALAALQRLVGAIDREQMAAMNADVRLDGRSETEVASQFLRDELAIDSFATSDPFARRMIDRTGEHLMLVGLSLLAAILIAIPLGVLAATRPGLGQTVIGFVGIGQTIPALALLVIFVPVLGIGAGPALVALFIYSLLPILRNTHAGLTGIPTALRESALALGLSARARLRRIELPLALPTILAGIKTAAVINVGGATLGALVGAGGYGQPIMTGIRLDDAGMILEGAVPAAVLALIVQWAFERAEIKLVPRGLRR